MLNNSDALAKLNTIALRLLSYQSLDELTAIIVQEAKKITGSEYGSLFLIHGEKIEKSISFPLLDKFLKGKKLEKILTSKNLKQLNKNVLNNINHELPGNTIGHATVIPLTYQKEIIAALLLFSSKQNIINNQSESLKLFCSMVTLALKKELTQKELINAVDMRDRFISLASHELRTPMTSINGYIQLLHTKMKMNKPLEPRWLDALYVESIRLNSLVKGILDINRIKQGQFAFLFHEVDMHDVVQKAIERYHVTHSEYQMLFEDNSSQTNHLVIGDFDKLVEMVSGIISNAIKFSNPGSKIDITLTNTSRNVILKIRDYGKGISRQDLETIFQGFYKSKNPNIEGMGVGLFLAQNIVENHRGKIQVNSKENKGTTVTITLPRADIK